MISSMIDGWMPSVGSSSRMSLGSAAQAARQRQDLLLAARQRAAGAVQERLRAAGNLDHARPSPRRRGPPLGARPCAGCRAPRGRERSAGPAARSRGRAARARGVGARVMSVPAKRIAPAVAGSWPISVFSSVVLPMPLWPRMPTNSPSATCEGDAQDDRDRAGSRQAQIARTSSIGVRRLLAEIDVAHAGRRPRCSATLPSIRTAPWWNTVTVLGDAADELHVVLDHDEGVARG